MNKLIIAICLLVSIASAQNRRFPFPSPSTASAAPETTWTEIWTVEAETGGTLSCSNSASIENFRIIISGSVISDTATTIRLKLIGCTGTSTYAGVAFGMRSGESGVYLASPAPVACKYGGAVISAGNPVVLGNGETAYTDPFVFQIIEDSSYLFHMWDPAGWAAQPRFASSKANCYYSGTATDFSLTLSFSESTSNAANGIKSIEKRVIH